MAQARIDIFASRFDSEESIGALGDDDGVAGLNLIGFGLDLDLGGEAKHLGEAAFGGKGQGDLAKDALRDPGSVVSDLAKGGVDAIRARARSAVDDVRAGLSKAFNAKDLAEGKTDAAAISGAMRAVTKLLRGGKEPPEHLVRQLGELGKVTDDPLLQATVAALFLVPPPMGPVLGGVTAGMLALVGPALELGDALGDAFDDLAHSGESAAAKSLRNALRDWDALHRQPQHPSGMVPYSFASDPGGWAYWPRDVSLNPWSRNAGQNARALKAYEVARKKWSRDRAAFEAGLSGEGAKWATIVAMEQLALKSAPIVGAADAGDPEATKALVALRVATDKGIIDARRKVKKIAQGFERNNVESSIKAWPSWGQFLSMCRGEYSEGSKLEKLSMAARDASARYGIKVPKSLAKDTRKAYLSAFAYTDRRMRLSNAKKAPKPHEATLRAAILAASKSLVTSVERAAERRGPPSGFFVSPWGVVVRGSWVQHQKGYDPGVLVMASRSVFGRWEKKDG